MGRRNDVLCASHRGYRRPEPLRWDDRAGEEVGEALVAFAAAELVQAGYDVSTEVLTGFPRSAVVRYAKQYGTDLVMIGSHGQRSVTRLLLGSVAQAVLRAASCSVEIVRQKAKRPLASAYRMNILLATDGSDGAMAAAKSLAARPWPAGSKIKIISVVELIVPGGEKSAASSSAAPACAPGRP